MTDQTGLFPERNGESGSKTSFDGGDASGHRARLRKRLMSGGEDALADHEVIEYLLMVARPRIDTKPIARSLIQRFGSLAGVLTADPQALALHPNMGETSAAALRIVALAARRLARTVVREQPVLSNWQALLDYLHIDMAHLNVERVRVLYLNTQNMLILDHLVGDGTLDESPIYTREVVKKGLDVGAAAMILVHNHPSGSPKPSRADIQVTQKITEAARLMGMTVHDHIVIGREGYTSLKAQGLI
ncbi:MULTISPECIES: DNA repair protein RadC [Novosphingobium]|jgi:DNA repair protein RadC|uniref:DNA repair protein RadC n=1 Tax=Novosphingobium subterraneum TaxID=48936 RepID=A0A0B9A7H3_9SPHN|nr:MULTISPECIES: DNA repair protein RadC [Novosphingobium]KHS46584.1 DNA repair protein RadC [Novosphingobium subterraneum]QOV93259.1 DNA repair protein RadC [Novosphingobium sp. ES2-1]